MSVFHQSTVLPCLAELSAGGRAPAGPSSLGAAGGCPGNHKTENRINGLSQYIFHLAWIHLEERSGEKATLPKVKALPFLQVDLPHHQKAVCILKCPSSRPGKTVHSEHTALNLAATGDHQAVKYDSFFLRP